jgi:hypothetical protein
MVSTAQQLIERACTESGFDDFGTDDWREGLDRIVAAIATDLHGSEDVERVEAIVVRVLVARLEVEHWYAEHGDKATAPVEGPLVIMGLPRTATTAVHFMLALDPQLRYLRTWERTHPAPPPTLETEQSDPRRVVPEQSAMHIRSIDGPTEDGALHLLSLRSSWGMPLPSFERWARHRAHPTTFAYEDRVLRMLHSHRPPHHWLLKYPTYAFNLDDLVSQWPDVQFIWTHRDPVKLVPSTCSVLVDGYRERVPDYEPDDWSRLGHDQLERFSQAANTGTATRARIGDERFIDVSQQEMNADAVAVAERIYDFAGLPLTSEQRTTIAKWAQENRAGSRGTHTYSAEQYGLTDQEIRDAFAPYLEVYGCYC